MILEESQCCCMFACAVQADDLQVMEAQTQSEMQGLQAAADTARAKSSAAEAAASASAARVDTLERELAAAESAMAAKSAAAATALSAAKESWQSEVAELQQQLEEACAATEAEVGKWQEQNDALQVCWIWVRTADVHQPPIVLRELVRKLLFIRNFSRPTHSAAEIAACHM